MAYQYADYPYYMKTQKPSFWEALLATGAKMAPMLAAKYLWGGEPTDTSVTEDRTNLGPYQAEKPILDFYQPSSSPPMVDASNPLLKYYGIDPLMGRSLDINDRDQVDKFLRSLYGL